MEKGYLYYGINVCFEVVFVGDFCCVDYVKMCFFLI